MQNAAEGIATGVSTGNSDGRNTSTANFTIAVASGTTVQFSFDNAVNLAASTAFPTESAIATIANALTIQDPNGVVIFSFTPDGTSGVLDPFSINTTLASNSGSAAAPLNEFGTFLSDVSPDLTAGTYTLSLRFGSSENLLSDDTVSVPEPSSLLLLGGGLVGFAAIRRVLNTRGAQR